MCCAGARSSLPSTPETRARTGTRPDTFANASGQPQIVWPDGNEDFGGTITVWTAFTEASEDMGSLQFIPGTHRTMYYDESKEMHYNPDCINQAEKQGVNRGFFGYDYRQLQIDPNWKPSESMAVSMAMRPGEAILFWSTLMHASHPHLGQTTEMRMAYAARYVPTCVRIYPDVDVIEEYGGKVALDRYGAVLVSGENSYTHNRIAMTTTRGHVFKNR